MKHEAFIKGITEILTKQNNIKEKEAHALQKAFHDSSKPYFDDFLLEEGLVEKSDLLKALAHYYQVPAMDVVGYFFSHELVRMFPKDFLIRNAIIPVEQVDDNLLIMVAADPNDQDLLSEIGTYVSSDIQFRVGLRQDILDAIEEFYERSLTDVDLDRDFDEEREAREAELHNERDLGSIALEEIDKHE